MSALGLHRFVSAFSSCLSGVFSSLWCVWLLLWNTGSWRHGLQELWHTGSVVVACGLWSLGSVVWHMGLAALWHMKSSWTRVWTHVLCIGRWVPIHCTTWRMNGFLLQYSCLGDPMDRRAWWATVHGVAESQTRLSGWAYMHHQGSPLCVNIGKGTTPAQ